MTAIFINNLWAYQHTGDTFNSARQWFQEKDSTSEIASMVIDGSVWFVDEEGLVLKYSQGENDSLFLSEANPPLSRASAVYTSEDSNSLYVLDKDKSRVIVYQKSGEYECQYRSPGVNQASDLLVAPNSGKILLLGESKIYEIILR